MSKRTLAIKQTVCDAIRYVPLSSHVLLSSAESNMVGRNKEWPMVIVCRVDKGIRSFWTSAPPYITSTRVFKLFRKPWSL